ncbi:MAG: hypothetical protein ABW047_16915 [Nitrospiraceae bacterium]
MSKTRPSRRTCLIEVPWIAVALGIVLVSGNVPSAAWGQDAPVAPEPAQEEPDSKLEPDQTGPPREPKFLPPRLRPGPLTKEEEEEAERLRKLGAKFGTDPTAIVGRVQLSAQYMNLPNGAHLTDAVLRVDLPFRKNWLLRMDLPYLRWQDPNRTGVSESRGLSDLSVAAGWRAYNTPEYAVFLGVLSTFPTSSQANLGSGKYNVGPILVTARFLPHWDSFLFGVFQHLTSVGGDPARRDLSLTRAVVQINTILKERWWTIVQGVWQVDWERNGKTSMTVEFELGRNIVGRWGVFVRPGVGIWGRDVIGSYDWNIEGGVRYMFPSF